MSKPLRGMVVALMALLSLASSGAAAVADHLLISEIVVQTRVIAGSPPTGSKYVEIVNPTAIAVDLSHVYLTDATNSPQTFYYNIVKLGGAGGGGAGGDFNARFPGGATIAPGDTIAVSIAGSADYQSAYGRLPDYELFEDGTVPDSVPDMVEAFPGSVGRGLGNAGSNVPDLSATNETVILYQWDGQSDLVQDLDYAIWGTVTSVRANKTGVRVDGPDAGTDSTAYKADTDIARQTPIANSAHNYGNSFQRRSLDEGAETASGGNGFPTGHDETSELLNQTWIATLAQSPPVAPATLPNVAPIFSAVDVAPPSPHAGEAATITATILAYEGNPVNAAALHWQAGDDAYQTVACTHGSGNAWIAEIPAQAEGTTVNWYLTAAGTSGGQAVRPAGAPNYTQVFVVGPAPVYPPKLLFSEVNVGGSEFIEIANPTNAAVDLTNYYLTDAIYTGQYYWQIVRGNPSPTSIGGGLFNDFHARFPAGASIPALGVVTVSITGSASYTDTYGVPPDFELYEDGAAADDVPDMREVFTGSNYNASALPTLSNAGEIVVLYYWDGQSDLVYDIDMFLWGTTTSYRFCKTDVCIDGPDADAVTSCYQPETATGAQKPFTLASGSGQSFQRKDATESSERKTGGNGTLGYDETSEDLNAAFEVKAFTPGEWDANGLPGVVLPIELHVPARTFLPLQGEVFPIKFRSQAGAETSLRIFDLRGQLICTFDIPQSSGSLVTKSWNGRDRDFELVPAGTYIVRLSVADAMTGNQQTKTAPVVVATRLRK